MKRSVRTIIILGIRREEVVDQKGLGDQRVYDWLKSKLEEKSEFSCLPGSPGDYNDFYEAVRVAGRNVGDGARGDKGVNKGDEARDEARDEVDAGEELKLSEIIELWDGKDRAWDNEAMIILDDTICHYCEVTSYSNLLQLEYVKDLISNIDNIFYFVKVE